MGSRQGALTHLRARGATGGTLNNAHGLPAATLPAPSSSFPGVDLLRETILKIPESTQLIILFMPVHFSTLPVPGTETYNRLEACKQRVAEAARRPNAHVIDFDAALAGHER